MAGTAPPATDGGSSPPGKNAGLVKVKAAWDKASEPPERAEYASDQTRLRYMKSWLWLRFMVGVLGLLLPIGTWLFSALLPDGEWALRSSLSAYYYSGMREMFTGTLAAIGVFLVAYKIMERSAESRATTVAGVAVLLVSFFPTSRPGGSDLLLTPLQRGINETVVGAVHATAAIVFIGLLGAISWLFGNREGSRTIPAPGAPLRPTLWRRVHHGCAIAIGVACGFFVIHLVGVSFGSWVDAHALWLTEVVSVVAFATSWTCKGFELRHWLGDESRVVPAA
jgi:hypothetical protein